MIASLCDIERLEIKGRRAVSQVCKPLTSVLNVFVIRRFDLRRDKGIISSTAVLIIACFMFGSAAQAADSIVIGVSTSLGFLEGKESLKAVEMAVEEINAAGGVSVGSEMRPFKVETIDLRDAAPGVPVPEALLGLEKIILSKKPAARSWPVKR